MPGKWDTSTKRLVGEAGKELLSITYLFASFVFEDEADRNWLKRRFGMLQDILRDTWAYKEIMQEGLQKGLQKGREQERQQRLKDQRQIFMTIIQTHFPNITDLAQKRVDAIKDPETLQSLVLKMFAAQTEEQAKQALLEVGKNKKKK